MDKLASAVKLDKTLFETHVVCEPIVLEALHVLSRHCNLVSRSV
jgi:hypothetical protein